jgi:hypothetical protein
MTICTSEATPHPNLPDVPAKPSIASPPSTSVDPSRDTDNEYSDPETDDSSLDDGSAHIPFVDHDDAGNQQYAAYYAENISLNDQLAEQQMIIPRDLFAVQERTHITFTTRFNLVNWMTALHHSNLWLDETLHNAVFYLDVMLSRVPLPEERMELFGAVCLWMSTKMNEMRPPTVDDVRAQCSAQYELEEFEACEYEVFQALLANLHYPCAVTFLRRYLDAIAAPDPVVDSANFLCECSLFAFELNEFRRSTLAFTIAIVAAADLRIPISVVPRMTYAHITDLNDVMPCARILLQIAHQIRSDRQNPTFIRFTSSSRSGSDRLRCDDSVLADIESLIS